MRYAFEVPEGFLLKGLHRFTTAKGADVWWAYIETAKPEYGKYHHFQGAQGFSLEDAIAAAHRALVKDLEARKRTMPASNLPKITIDLSSILKGR